MDDYYITFPVPWISPEIIEQIGKAVWLLLLLMSWTTCSHNGLGLVYGGKELRDEQLYSKLGISQSSLMRYRNRLEKCGILYTKTTWQGLKRWFLIGFTKYKNKKLTDRQRIIATTALKGIIASSPEDPSTELNPYYSQIIMMNSDDIPQTIDNDEELDISEGERSNSEDEFSKNDVRISDKDTDSINDKYGDKERRAFGPQLKPITKDKIDPVIMSIYELYNGHARTGRTKPSDEVKELIRKALERIGEMSLTSAIYEYLYQIGVEGSSERPVSPEEFFGRQYSHYTLVPIHMLENSEDGIPW